MPSREALLERERRWARPAGIAALAAVAIVVAGIVVAAQVGGAEGDAEQLRNVYDERGAQLISNILRALGVGLLAAPLLFLFRAAEGRSEAVRGQLVGVVIAGPIFLAISVILVGISTIEAADDFVQNEIPALEARGIPLDGDRADEVAEDSVTDAPLRFLAAGFGLGGQLGFVIGFFYTAMQAMRAGLLTRFWGSLGMALAAVSFLLFEPSLLWFIYLGILLVAVVPRGQPPAWGEGRAIPWPTPGEEAASALGQGADEEGEHGEDAGPPKKRKQRS